MSYSGRGSRVTDLAWMGEKRNRRRSEMRLRGKTYEQVAAQEELSLRPASRLRVRIGPRAFSLLAAITMVLAIGMLFISDSFYVHETVVHGNSLTSPNEIYQHCGVQGYSIFFINPRQVEKAILSLPDVRETHVQLGLPHHMIVELRERQPVVIWETGQERHGVDEEGTILPLRGDEPSILIRDLDATPSQPDEQSIAEIVTSAQRYSALIPEVTTFTYSREYGLSLVDEHGWRVHLGDDESADAKVAIMKVLVEKLVDQQVIIDFIDLRFPENPYYHLAEGTASETGS